MTLIQSAPEKLRLLEKIVQDHCNHTDYTLQCYVSGDDKQSVIDFESLRQSNHSFEASFKSFVKKFGYHLEGNSVAVTDDELNAFTKAYNIQKLDAKRSIESLTMLGADRKYINVVENKIVSNKKFLSDFIQFALSWGS